MSYSVCSRTFISLQVWTGRSSFLLLLITIWSHQINAYSINSIITNFTSFVQNSYGNKKSNIPFCPIPISLGIVFTLKVRNFQFNGVQVLIHIFIIPHAMKIHIPPSPVRSILHSLAIRTLQNHSHLYPHLHFRQQTLQNQIWHSIRSYEPYYLMDPLCGLIWDPLKTDPKP